MKLGTVELQNLERVMEIISRSQEQLNSIAALDWTLSMIEFLIKSSQSMAVFDEMSNQRLLAFCFYENKGDICEVMVLATHPDLQGKGYMTRILHSLQQLFSEIWLEVHEKNSNALKFYLACGFIITGRRKKYYKDNSDGILMTWKRELAIL